MLNIGRRATGNTVNTRLRQVADMPREGSRLVPSQLFFWAAGLSVVASLTLKLMGREDDSLFVGEWPPTFLALGAFSRLAER